MKKLLILLFSILLSFNSYGGLFDKTVCVETDAQERDGLIYLPNKTKPFSGKNLCLHEDSQKKSQGKIKDGKIEGKWTVWYESGKKESEGKYKNGKENGKWIWWYKNTQKEREAKYKDGKLDGKSIMWHENGKIRKTICIEDTETRDGLIYLPNETIPFTGNFLCKPDDSETLPIWIEGEIRDGEYSYETRFNYFENGQVDWQFLDEYDGGLLIQTKSITFFENGEIASEENYNAEYELFGRYISSYENGQRSYEYFLIDDMNGTFTGWHENGQLREVGTLKDNMIDGKYTKWYESGQIQTEGIYIDGKPEGKYKDWNENGQIESESNWKDGECISGDCPD